MDINKFVQRSKRNTCISNALFMSHSCKGTSRINLETDVITRLNQHNHGIEDYNTDVYELKTECKNNTKNSKRNIRKVFDDRTRMDPHACEISFRECESAMYRARRTIQPIIPLNAQEFSDMLSTTSYGEHHHKSTVRCGEATGVIFFSNQMTALLAEITNVQFDGTSFTVPRQFSQLWTIFDLSEGTLYLQFIA